MVADIPEGAPFCWDANGPAPSTPARCPLGLWTQVRRTPHCGRRGRCSAGALGPWVTPNAVPVGEFADRSKVLQGERVRRRASSGRGAAPVAHSSAATVAVSARPNTPATGQPTISGTAQVGETLTADVSSIADEDGLDNATFTYQWLAGTSGWPATSTSAPPTAATRWLTPTRARQSACG